MTVHPRISTQALASGGYLPTAVLNHVALCGWSPHGGAAGEEGPTLMDQMMAESSVARKKVEKQKQRQRKKESKTFGSGMKGGFFSAPKKSKKKGGNKKGSSKVRAAGVAVVG